MRLRRRHAQSGAPPPPVCQLRPPMLAHPAPPARARRLLQLPSWLRGEGLAPCMSLRPAAPAGCCRSGGRCWRAAAAWCVGRALLAGRLAVMSAANDGDWHRLQVLQCRAAVAAAAEQPAVVPAATKHTSPLSASRSQSKAQQQGVCTAEPPGHTSPLSERQQARCKRATGAQQACVIVCTGGFFGRSAGPAAAACQLRGRPAAGHSLPLVSRASRGADRLIGLIWGCFRRLTGSDAATGTRGQRRVRGRAARPQQRPQARQARHQSRQWSSLQRGRPAARWRSRWAAAADACLLLPLSPRRCPPRRPAGALSAHSRRSISSQQQQRSSSAAAAAAPRTRTSRLRGQAPVCRGADEPRPRQR